MYTYTPYIYHIYGIPNIYSHTHIPYIHTQWNINSATKKNKIMLFAAV